MSNITIKINDTEQEFPSESTLAKLIFQRVGDRQRGIAVAVNRQVIPREDHERYFLKANDQILIIKATQGG